MNHEVIWEQLNTSEEHRARVIEWLDAMINTQVMEEVEGLKQRAQALTVEEAYRVSKSIAMKRYVDRVQSPQSQISTEAITEHFSRSWSQSADQFHEARDGDEFHLETSLGEQEQNELEGFMLDDKHISEVIRSRQDPSANGTHGIGSRIITAAKKDGVQFMKLLVGACVRNGRIRSSWKEARTILLHMKGDREQVQNWRPISVTNCIYRVFTCAIARSWHAINAKAQ
jgi:hypothetical protein